MAITKSLMIIRAAKIIRVMSKGQKECESLRYKFLNSKKDDNRSSKMMIGLNTKKRTSTELATAGTACKATDKINMPLTNKGMGLVYR